MNGACLDTRPNLEATSGRYKRTKSGWRRSEPDSKPITAWPSKASSSRLSVSTLLWCWPLSIREMTDFTVLTRPAKFLLVEAELSAPHDHDPGDLLERTEPFLGLPKLAG